MGGQILTLGLDQLTSQMELLVKINANTDFPVLKNLRSTFLKTVSLKKYDQMMVMSLT